MTTNEFVLRKQSGRKEKGIWLLCPNPSSSTRIACLGRRVKVEDLPSSIIATGGADPVWQHLVLAIGTLHEMGRADGIVRASAVAPPLAQFTFW
jgi:hypothetical protein